MAGHRSADVEAHRDLLVRLVAEMDTRIPNLPPRRDKFTRFHAGFPLIVVVLEEFAGCCAWRRRPRSRRASRRCVSSSSALRPPVSEDTRRACG
ncbi:hypothetical protein [Pseudonocardia sp. Ae717_Ps2]|uniref:hypothetical protein n=1 Tax=Pseudonocardia sp. Ae717_Ps2 TaxID=1885573 RepID=UPI0011847EED|nr:hypothetical protein [Pseudonocardia sp. Ae717_Ps2]